jgi:uncharacterized protein YjbJ (UPF0337 family)
MIQDVIQTKWQVPRGKISRWWNKRTEDQDFKVSSQRERLIKILQKRYGYSKEKAEAELDTTYAKALLG